MNRQHPFAMVQYMFTFIKGFIFWLIVISFSEIRKGQYLFPSLYLIGMMLIGFVIGLLRWLNTSYDLDEEHFHLKKGIISKTHETYPHIKISGVHYQSNRLLESLGLTSISIETAGKATGASATLFLKKEEAYKLEQNIIYYAQESGNEELTANDEESTEDKKRNDFVLPWKYLIIMSATSNSFYIGFAIIISSLNQVYDVLSSMFENSFLFSKVEEFSLSGLFLSNPALFFTMILISALGSWAIGIIILSLRYANFTVRREQNTIHISYGLWTMKNISLEVDRIQAIRVQEGVVRRWIGFNSVAFDSIGFDATGEAEEAVLLPLVKRNQTWSLINKIVPEFYVEPNLTYSPVRARIRFYLRGAIFPLLVIVGAGFIWSMLWWLGVIAPLLVYLSELRYRDNGIQTVSNKVITSSRLIQKETVVIPWQGLQSVMRRESFFQRRRSLATFELAVATDQTTLLYKAAELDTNLYPSIIEFLQQEDSRK
ncbi:PH domain-containing protein [Pontibacillus yanchengensis]|uniref:PH domain-containing protein n=2 Tax=Pontibacillus yanchengensis TaxID=462910 RepID=A0A6I4ZU02_9BACI|nr:PH domain-containing protein [Pontibacillus yanchengensis]